ncbi:formin-like protein 4 [Bidens hawaiensis]|uniref:formin-like protein 4 n=1 Tax=Bidens hawaiensis TaxID=980011 RepID=UPI00404982DA
MAAKIQCPPSLLLLLFVFSSFIIPPSSSQSGAQNIEVFYPFIPLPLPPPPRPPPPSPPSPPPRPPTDTTPTPPPNPVTTSPPSNSSNKTVAKAVGVTAASTLVLSGLLFLLLVKYKRYRKENKNPRVNNGNKTGNTSNAVLMLNDRFTRVEGIKGVIVDEEGLDVLYWKNLDDDDDSGDKNAIFNKKEHPARVDHGGRKSKKFDVPIQEAPLLDEESSGSQVYQQSLMTSQRSSRTLPPTPPPQAVAENKNIVPLPPPPPRVVGEQKSNLPPPPPPPRPQVVGGQKTNLPPPPPLPLAPKTNGLASSTEPPQQKVQLKPLHWDKVNANVGHPTAWDKMDNGSFRFDGDFMEAMFGTVAANKKSPRHDNSSSPTIKQKSGPPPKIFILDTRKSQNIAIILRSLNVSRQEIIDCLLEGKGLDLETLEKLTKIHPTKEEEEQILNNDQDTTKLADAESFLYHILKPVPSAFTRFNAMFFRLSYTSEVTEIKNTLQTLETACKELRTRGLFVKLLEAVLKAGNRMNVGTSRGNAQAFNMNSLLKLSDVKSSDGKTTLLHFVVEEVVRLEGKRCMINNNNNNNQSFKFKDYIRLGLPTVGGVSSEFTNVKKAAAFDYDAVLRSCSGLTDRLDEIKKTVKECGGDGEERGFVREMERFVERAEREIQILRGDQERVIGLVKKINEYYQAGASKDKGRKLFQLFVIVEGFLEMVDKACNDIAVKLQKKRYGNGDEAVTAAVPNRPTMKFPVLPPDFISSSSSDSEDTDDDDDGL